MREEPLDERSTFRPLQAWYGGGWVWNEPEPQPEPPDPNTLGPLDLPGIGPPDPVDQSAFGAERGLGQGTGVVLGRFLPPHAGHQYLLDFARALTPNLHVFVRVHATDPIPSELRLRWLREMAPEAEQITAVSADAAPEDPQELSAWWASRVRAAINAPDWLFGSDERYAALAQELNAEYVLVDPSRGVAPISGSQIREDPLGHWAYLPACVRPHYVRRVVILGPEGTGKTTLARQLAWHYGTVMVPEYARTLLSTTGRRWEPADVQRIARGQRASESALARQANRLLFCDTDLLEVSLWSERLFGTCPAWVRDEANRPSCDLYLVTECDLPLQGEGRPPDTRRQAFLDRCVAELTARRRPFVRIRGGWEQRFDRARQAVDDLVALRSVD